MFLFIAEVVGGLIPKVSRLIGFSKFKIRKRQLLVLLTGSIVSIWPLYYNEKIGWKKHKKQVWFASLVWYDRVSSVETSLFRPSIYLVWVLGALEALQCIICHYLRTDGITELRNYEQIRPSIIIDIEHIPQQARQTDRLQHLILNLLSCLLESN